MTTATPQRRFGRLQSSLFVGALVALVAAVSMPSGVLAQSAGGRWVTTWGTAVMIRPLPGQLAPGQATMPATNAALAQSALNPNNQTLRQIVRVSVGGERVRVVLSNAFGTAPLPVGTAHVALRDRDAAIVPQSDRELTFSGRTNATIPAGAVLVSDPVSLSVPAMADLAIDLYLPADTASNSSPASVHAAAWQTSYLSPVGNHAGKTILPVEATTDFMRGALPSSSWFYLARVEVLAPDSVGTIVAFGDSITDGTASGNNTNSRWPDHFSRRLNQANIKMGVLNVGIGGNRVLADGTGYSALARFDRDVLAQTGVTHVVVLEGINDIGQARTNPTPSAADVIAGHMQLIERAHARGLKIYGATLTPFEGAAYYTAEGEAKRQALNSWIRTGGAYDGVIDFDAALRDPSRPTRILPQYDPGDHLHANATGYQAMANAIDLSLFKPGAMVGRTSSK